MLFIGIFLGGWLLLGVSGGFAATVRICSWCCVGYLRACRRSHLELREIFAVAALAGTCYCGEDLGWLRWLHWLALIWVF